MTRKTIIFGNGLGMAVNSAVFALDPAMGRTWDGAVLDEDQKTLIRNCLPLHCADRPHSEDDMDSLQLALAACEFLGGAEAGQVNWLTQQGQQFPSAVRQFFYNVARGFHEYDTSLPDKFVDPLAEFVWATRSHVATLNYDSLIYRPMIERRVLHGYNGALCDGMLATGFSPENLERRYGKDFGYYLHLHGSPLFVGRGDAVYKLSLDEGPGQNDVVGAHLVLTHVKHKPTVISSSDVLFSYWQYLTSAIYESNEVVLVGYSGCDAHLNALLRAVPKPIAFRIVEWDQSDHGFPDPGQFWSQILGRNQVCPIRLPSVLDFTDWSGQGHAQQVRIDLTPRAK